MMDVRPQLVGSSKIFTQEGDREKRAERGQWGKESGITLRQSLLSKHTWVYIDWKLIWSSLEADLIEMMGALTSFLHQQRTPRTSTALDIRAHAGVTQRPAGLGPDQPRKASIAIKKTSQ